MQIKKNQAPDQIWRLLIKKKQLLINPIDYIWLTLIKTLKKQELLISILFKQNDVLKRHIWFLFIDILFLSIRYTDTFLL